MTSNRSPLRCPPVGNGSMRRKTVPVSRKAMEASPPPSPSVSALRTDSGFWIILRKLTLERSLGPGASDALLRHLEGQRHLFAYITALVAQGVGER